MGERSSPRKLLLATVAAAVLHGPVVRAQLNPSPSTQPGTADSIRVLLDQAIYLRSKDQTKKADEALNRVLSLDSHNPDALALKGQTAAEAGNDAVAVAMMARLRETRPDDPRIESIRQLIEMGPLDKAGLAEARRFAGAGRTEEAVAVYQRVFRGGAPPPGLSAEYYQTLGAAEASWLAQRDKLSAELRANPEDLKAQVAFAELLTYHAPTRELGVARLRQLAQSRTIANQVNLDLRQVEAAHLAAQRAATPTEPRPRSSVDQTPPQAEPRIVPASFTWPADDPARLPAVAARADFDPRASARMQRVAAALPTHALPVSAPPTPPPLASPSPTAQRLAETPGRAGGGGGGGDGDAADPSPVIRVLAVAVAEPVAEPVTREYAQYVPPQPVARTAPARLNLADPPESLMTPAPQAVPVSSAPLAPPAAPDVLAPPAPIVLAAADGTGDAPYVNPFRVTSAPTLDEPSVGQPALRNAEPSPRGSVDPLTADIDRSIRQVSADMAPRLEASLGLRGRSGSDGLSKLFDIEAPVEASFSPGGYGRLKVTVTPVYLFSGSASGNDLQLYGTNPLVAGGPLRQGSKQAAGSALDVSYAYGPLSGDVGSTPIGFHETNVVGGVQYAPRLTNNLVLRLTAERRAVTDSLLSYGGQRDARTGVTWGGVTRNRLYVQVEAAIGPYNIYAGAGGAGLFGTRVQTNTEIEAGAGFSVPVYTTPTKEIRVGTNLVYFGFNRNLGNFTLGQGGYFSPQDFFAALFPVTFRHQVTPDLTYSIGGSVGVQTFRTKSTPVFPTDTGLESQLAALAAAGGPVASRFTGSHSFGPAGGASAEVDYRVNDRLHIGAKAGFDKSGDFTEGTGLVYARYVFADPN